MSEYTPSTADIKRVHEEQFNLYYAEEVRAKEHAKEFDRWLAKHDAEVAKAERQRIIELLQREASEWISKGKEDLQLIALIEDLRLIALIKERTNE